VDTTISILYILFIFLKLRLQCSDNFDSNISTQRFVSTEKFTFKIDDLWKSCRKRGGAAILAYRRPWWRHHASQ